MSRERQARWGLAALAACGWGLVWLAEALAGDHSHREDVGGVGHTAVTAAGGVAIVAVALAGLFALANWHLQREHTDAARLTFGIALSLALPGLPTWLLDSLDQSQGLCFNPVGGCTAYAQDSVDYAVKAGGILALVAIAAAAIGIIHGTTEVSEARKT